MGAPGEQLRLHQAQAVPGLKGAVQGFGRLAAGNRTVVDGHLLFLLILQQEALQTALRRRELPQDGAEVFFGNLPVPDLCSEDPQGLGVFRGNDNAAGVAVDAVA